MKVLAQIVFIVILVVLSVSISRGIYTQWTKLRDIQKSEEKINLLTQENSSLQNQLNESQTPFFIEKEARDKLGYQRPGEVLYLVEEENAGQAEIQAKKPVWKQWLEFVFPKDFI
jgi:cell division protein FtsB